MDIKTNKNVFFSQKGLRVTPCTTQKHFIFVIIFKIIAVFMKTVPLVFL